jgi:hypothetical protein
VMAPDRQHLHHRLLTIGHSYRQSVLIMYLWAALFSVTVVSLSVVRTRLVVLEAATIIAVLALLPVTMPRLRPWHSAPARRPVSAPAHAAALASDASGAPGARRHRADRAEAARSGRSPRDAPPLSPRVRTQGPALNGPPPSAVAPPPGPVFHAAPTAAAPNPITPAAPGLPGETPWFTSGGSSADAPQVPGDPMSWVAGGGSPADMPQVPGDPMSWVAGGGYPADMPQVPGEPMPWVAGGGYPADTPWVPGEPQPWFTDGGYRADAPPVPGEPLPRAGRLPGTEPAYPAQPAQSAYTADPQDPFPGPGWRPAPGYLPAGGAFSGPGPFAGPLADGGAPDVPEPLPQAQQRDLRPWQGRDLDFSLPLFTLPLPSPAVVQRRQAHGLPRRGCAARWS